ncbi:Arylamine N-acetyltransferase [Aspergillus sclerotialis]|uniref:Arylamine N-acetyltransferase n=1 Tax=Aspergillus sclerotialis TaxID=2070753 RepID=A0A3A2ZK84_9EURO|nr:Arylamine N-acetyltransferase [Aspergillus sclerotialis]
MLFDSNTDSALSAEQIDQYLEHIQVPSIYRRNQGPKLDISFLSTLQACHLSTIPYENLALHYTDKPHVSLDVETIHRKIIFKRRGGYCMENNILLHHVLRFLGFQVYLTGARLHRTDDNNQSSGWTGWEHCINIVTLPDQQRYLVDVGYGGNGPRAPLPLALDEASHNNIGTQEVRLIRNPDASSCNPQQNLWLYQFRNSETQPWVSGYAFTDIEFTFRDFEVMNFFTSGSRDCFLTSRLLVVKFLRMDDRIYGKLVLDHDRVKKNLGGRSEVLQTCTTETERVNALEHHFGLRLTQDELSGIKGRISALAC